MHQSQLLIQWFIPLQSDNALRNKQVIVVLLLNQYDGHEYLPVRSIEPV